MIHADVVIIGAGLAGLTATWHLDDRTAVVLRPARDNPASYCAKGGIAAAIGEDDDPEHHLEDTLTAGGELVDPDVAEVLATEGIDRMIDLFELPVAFDRDDDGTLELGREALHSRPRIVHADGDKTGRHVTSTVRARLERRQRVSFVDGRALELVVDGQHRVCGVVYLDSHGETTVIATSAVVLATGGIGGLYEKTTNPPSARGEGLALAARAGASLADLEFVQFHPTALDCETRPLPLVSEAIRGKGATLVDGDGQRLMADHPDGDLAGRDTIARTIWQRLEQGEQIWLDCTTIDHFARRFPSADAACRHRGFDPGDEPIPVVPAAHYHMGGVATDEFGRTDVDGLWAAGEVASTGAHGANRLASNSMLEAMVFGARVGRDVSTLPHKPRVSPLDRFVHLRNSWRHGLREAGDPDEILDSIRRVMWQNVGIERTQKTLDDACEQLGEFVDRLDRFDPVRLPVEAARVVARAARRRTESRGAHYRSDFPQTDPGFATRIFTGRHIDHADPDPTSSTSIPATGEASHE